MTRRNAALLFDLHGKSALMTRGVRGLGAQMAQATAHGRFIDALPLEQATFRAERPCGALP